jgi:hypothetical protein
MAEELLEYAYDLATSNCENFAYYCRTGKWESKQVQKIKDLLINRALEIYDEIKNADEKNRKNIGSLVNSIPTVDERVLYDQFREDNQH